MTNKGKKYETGKIRGSKRQHGQDMRKFQVKKGVRYYFSPVKHFRSKKKAQKYVKGVKKERPSTRHRIIKNPISTYNKVRRKYTVYQTVYP